jgi:hypothetical protein
VIELAFRFDDPSAKSDHALEREIISRFRDAAAPLTAAVVPFDCRQRDPRALTAAAVPHLVAAQAEGLLEVALHGYCHRARAGSTDGNPTEFAGLDADRQSELLRQGKTALEQVFPRPVTGFVPPWNSYDGTTLRLLAELGFTHLSADWALVTHHPLPLVVIPHTCALRQLRDAVAEARQLPDRKRMLLVILHHFDLAESGNKQAAFTLGDLAELLSWASEQADIRLTHLSGLAAELEPDHCARNLRLAHWCRTLHWRLQSLFPRHTLLAEPAPRFLGAITRNALRRLPRAIAR